MKSLHFQFHKRMLVADTELLRRNKDHKSLDALLGSCQSLINAQLADVVVETALRPRERREICQAHFGRPVREWRDFRGIPLLGWILPFERADAPYLLHFDSDVVFHQPPSADWVSEAISLLERHHDVVFLSPRRPTAPDGALVQESQLKDADADGLFRFKTFSSRRFLLHRERWRSLLPLKPVYVSRKRRVASWFTGRSAIWNWEALVGHRLADSALFRAHTSSFETWALHAPDHGERFITLLDEIITHVEAGRFPAAQAGHYDLELDLWENFIRARP